MKKNTIKAVIDRIEDNVAVLEIDHTELVLPLRILPKGSKEGNILNINISINSSDEKKQIEKIKKLQQKLKNS